MRLVGIFDYCVSTHMRTLLRVILPFCFKEKNSSVCIWLFARQRGAYTVTSPNMHTTTWYTSIDGEKKIVKLANKPDLVAFLNEQTQTLLTHYKIYCQLTK